MYVIINFKKLCRLHIMQKLVSHSQTAFFHLHLGGEKRVWTSERRLLVSYTPTFKEGIHESQHLLPTTWLNKQVLVVSYSC